MTKEMESRVKLSLLMAVEAMRKAGSVLESLMDLIEASEAAEKAAEERKKGAAD